MGAGKGIQLKGGSSVGVVRVVHEVASSSGIDEALGTGFAGEPALRQVIARVIDRGSRLFAARLAKMHAAGDVLGIRRGFDENDPHENLNWLCE